MSTFGENQVNKFFVATASTDAGVANIGALSEGEVQAFASDGTKATGTEDKFIVATLKGGITYTSEIIESAKVKRTVKDDTGTTNLTTYDIAFTGTPVAGEYVSAIFFIDNYGANQGSGQPFPFHIGYTIQASDTATDVVNGLKANLLLTTAATSDMPITDNTSVTSTWKVVCGRTPFSLGKMDGKPLVTKISVRTKNTGLSAAVTEGTTTSNNGIEIANLEWFTLGNTGDIYRGVGYPNNFEGDYNVTPTVAYETINSSYYSERISAPGDKQMAQYIVVADTANLVQFEASIETILGITLA